MATDGNRACQLGTTLHAGAEDWAIEITCIADALEAVGYMSTQTMLVRLFSSAHVSDTYTLLRGVGLLFNMFPFASHWLVTALRLFVTHPISEILIHACSMHYGTIHNPPNKVQSQSQ